MFNNIISEDWRADGYRWKQNGTSKLPGRNPVVDKVHFALLVPGGRSDGFQKYVYKPRHRSDVVVVHYRGNEKVAVDFPHGLLHI